MNPKTLDPVIIVNDAEAVEILYDLGVGEDFLDALDKRQLATDGFTGATCDTVETHWVFAGRYAGRSNPPDNGLLAYAVAKSLMSRSQFVAHIK